MKAFIPQSQDAPDGPFYESESDQFEILAERNDVVLIEFFDKPEEIVWFDDFDLMYCQRIRGQDTIKVIRLATNEERHDYRVPLWIQGEYVPDCCGQSMFFVGQIDDDRICMEPPSNAELWWHDKASFYVFTCPKCLECKAIGQQF